MGIGRLSAPSRPFFFRLLWERGCIRLANFLIDREVQDLLRRMLRSVSQRQHVLSCHPRQHEVAHYGGQPPIVGL